VGGLARGRGRREDRRWRKENEVAREGNAQGLQNNTTGLIFSCESREGKMGSLCKKMSSGS